MSSQRLPQNQIVPKSKKQLGISISQANSLSDKKSQNKLQRPPQPPPQDQKQKMIKKQSTQNIQNRQSRFSKVSQAQSKQSRNNSKSSVKQHRLKINRLNLQKRDEFVAYSIVNKQSNSGMFSHQRLLVLNSQQRKLMYYSNIPKNLPFATAEQYLQYSQKPKQVIDLQKVKKFTFLPTRLNIGQILVGFVQNSQRKQWKLVLGSNKIMNEWVQMVNEVYKKQHYEQRKRQIRYPPKQPAPQQIQQTNNYQTPFIKQLKQFITEDIDQQQRQRKKTQVRRSIDSTKFLKNHQYIVDLPVHQELEEEEKSEDIWLNLQTIKKQNKIVQEQRKRVHTATQELSQNKSQLQNKRSEQIRPKKQTAHTVILNSASKKPDNKLIIDPYETQKTSHLTKSHMVLNKNEKQTGHKDLKLYVQQDQKTFAQKKYVKQQQRRVQIDLKQNSRFSSPSQRQKRQESIYNNSRVTENNSKDVSQSQILTLHQSPTQKKSQPFYSNKSQNQPSKISTVANEQISHRYTISHNNNSLLFKQRQSPPQRKDQPKRNSIYSQQIASQQGGQKQQKWLSLWLQSAPSLKKQIYANFIKKCKSIIPQIINNIRYHQTLSQKNQTQYSTTHFNFKIQGICFKFIKKVLLPEGINQLRDIFQLAKSEQLVQNILKHNKELQNQYNNFAHIYNSLSEQFHQSMPVHLPITAFFSYKSISILCKAHIGTCQSPMTPITSQSQLNNYQPYLQYIQEKCHVNFLKESFKLYQVNLGDRKILYMDSLTQFIPSIKKYKEFKQIPSQYIKHYIKKGFIDNRNDLNQIDNHITKSVVKVVCQELQVKRKRIVNSDDLLQILRVSGLQKSYLPCLYTMLSNSWIKSVVISEIISNIYFSMCQIYMFKLFIFERNNPSDFSRNSYRSEMQNSPNIQTRASVSSKSPTMSFTKYYDQIIYQCLQCLLYKNSKLWNHFSTVLRENYGLSFSNNLLNHVNWKYLISSFLMKLNISANVKYWSQNSGWQKVQLKKQQLQLTSILSTKNLPLSLFKPQFQLIFSQIKISLQTEQSSLQTYQNLIAILQIQKQTFNKISYLLMSDEYTLLNQHQKSNVKHLISHYFALAQGNHHHLQRQSYLKNKNLQVYQFLISRQNHSICSINDYETNLLGIKWIIKARQYELAKILLQEQMESLSIWTQNYSLIAKFYDVSSLFFLKMHNHTNSIIYSLKSLQLAIDYQQEQGDAHLAQKAFQAANVHFECSQFVKSLQFYQITTDIIQKLSKGSLSYLTIQFLNMYSKKAGIYLAIGNITQSLNECVNCLAKCQQYYNQELCDYQEIDGLHDCEISCFQIMFRCYEITKKWNQMIRLSSLCCIKFMEDGILKQKVQKDQRSSNHIISKLLRVSWLSLLHFIFDSNGSKQSTKYNSKILKRTVQRLIATYPIKRYHPDQIISYFQQQIVYNRDQQNSLSTQYKRSYHNEEGNFGIQNSVMISILNQMILAILKNDSQWRTTQIRQKNNRISQTSSKKQQPQNSQVYQQQSPPIFPYNLYNLKNNIDSKMMILEGVIILTSKEFMIGSLKQYDEISQIQNWE